MSLTSYPLLDPAVLGTAGFEPAALRLKARRSTPELRTPPEAADRGTRTPTNRFIRT